MQYQTELDRSGTVAIVGTDHILIQNEQVAVDFIANIRYETGCDKVILPMSALPRDFFILSSGLAGAVLQKFTTYQMKIAIVGDYSGFTSKPLHDFIYESNKGNSIFFVGSISNALEKLGTGTQK